jgi:hypothetical protein
MKHIIIRYLAKQMKDSLVCYEVNGTPFKRIMRINSLAVHQYNKLTKAQKIKLFVKILFKIIFNK